MKRKRLLLVLACSLLAALALVACARAFGASPATPDPGFSVVVDDEQPLDLTVILGVDTRALERPLLVSSHGIAPATHAVSGSAFGGPLAYDAGAACELLTY